MSIAGTAGDALAKLGILDEVQGKTLEMKLPRRNFLHLAAGAAALPAMSRIAKAQAYASRPVRWVVGFPAGGGVTSLRA